MTLGLKKWWRQAGCILLMTRRIIATSTHVTFLWLVVMCSVCYADTLPKVISKSSDGRYEVRPVNVDFTGLGSFNLGIFNAKTGLEIKELPAHYDIAHGCDWVTLWHPSLPILAIHVSDGRRVGHIDIYRIYSKKVISLSVPDYLPKALGKVNANEIFNTAFSSLIEWNKNDLNLDLEFNACEKGTRDFQGMYECSVALRVHPSDSTVELLSVTIPKEQ